MASNSRARKSSSKESPDLQELLVLELQEIHSAEKQLSRLIPRLVKAASSETLQQALEERAAEGEQVLEDVEAALEELESTPGRKKNVAAEGLVNDLREHVQELQAGPALDTVLIGGLQKTEHYCIAAWGTTQALGKACGQRDLVGAMERALEEGKAYDQRLTELAESEVTPALEAEGTGESEEGEEALAASGAARMGRQRGRGANSGQRAR